MSNSLKIYVLNTIFVGTESINSLKEEIKIDGIIGLKNNFQDLNVVSGFDNMESYCESNNISFVGVNSYNLRDDEDKRILQSLEIDVLLVLGWQRLVPKWLLDNVRVISIGVHGSPWGKDGGRGRSPINWALICNKSEFIIDIFKLDAQIDSGEVIDEQKFTISEFDDINSVYFKVSWCISKMIARNIKNGHIYNYKSKNERLDQIRYLPKRSPEDGEIDWNRTNVEVYNFIRALTKPYPGAFSFFNDNKLIIWRAIPFEEMEGFEVYKPGEIIRYFTTHNEFIVKCKVGAILVKDYQVGTTNNIVVEKKILTSCSFKEQMHKIIDRHYSVYKESICNEEIENLT